jgi:antitoxin HicB
VIYQYAATLEPDETGRLLVRFPDLPEALTDGADQAEALREATDCLSEALASRIVDGEDIPAPAGPKADQYPVSPDPTIALKAALYMALRQHELTVADLADRLDIDWHQAARLIDPKRTSKMTSLQAALNVVGCRITVVVDDENNASARGSGKPPTRKPVQRPTSWRPDEVALLRAIAAYPAGMTTDELWRHLYREPGMSAELKDLRVWLRRLGQAGRLEQRDGKWHPSATTKADTATRSMRRR